MRPVSNEQPSYWPSYANHWNESSDSYRMKGRTMNETIKVHVVKYPDRDNEK